jgi:putative hydroxymethylpyrimidine transport system substrate-binding protein
MTAPDGFPPMPNGAGRPGCETVRIGLEWFVNPDHLALIAARDWGVAAARGLSLELVEPGGNYDGFAALEKGGCDLILTEPLHLLEPMARRCEPLGCLFETHGGVLVREDRLGKLRASEVFRVAAPVTGALTDGLCRRIVQAWAGTQGIAVAETQIVVEAAGFRHVDNLATGHDAAWLAFANVEEVSARDRGLAVRLLTAESAGLPGFSALELVARSGRSADEVVRHEAVIEALEEAASRLRADPAGAVALWRQASSGGDSEEAAAIVLATLPCLRTPLDRRPDRWEALEALLQEA